MWLTDSVAVDALANEYGTWNYKFVHLQTANKMVGLDSGPQ